MKKKDLQAAKEKSAAFNTELNKNRKKELLDFCDRVHIHFKNLELLDLAFHHRSVTNEKRNFYNNERLEFLGDSVLGMVTAAYLYSSLENPEGDLAKIKSIVVSEKALAPVALKFAVDKLLVLGHGEEMTGGRKKPPQSGSAMSLHRRPQSRPAPSTGSMTAHGADAACPSPGACSIRTARESGSPSAPLRRI